MTAVILHESDILKLRTIQNEIIKSNFSEAEKNGFILYKNYPLYIYLPENDFPAEKVNLKNLAKKIQKIVIEKPCDFISKVDLTIENKVYEQTLELVSVKKEKALSDNQNTIVWKSLSDTTCFPLNIKVFRLGEVEKNSNSSSLSAFVWKKL